MTMLVSIDQAKAALRYDDDDNDLAIQLAIEAASSACLTYLKTPDAYQDSSGIIPTDSNGDPLDIPADVQRAVIFLAGSYLRDPAGIEGKDLDMNYLPRPVLALLYPYRNPTYA